MKEHRYTLTVSWTGNSGSGTSGYKNYNRDHDVIIEGKQVLHCSSDAAFHGNKMLHNPEDLFLASLSSCHMLWYLHLCADAGVIVTAYTDKATGTLSEKNEGGGNFTSVTLHPVVTVKNKSMINLALTLHEDANKKCFIANSCNFPVTHAPLINSEH